MSSKIQQILPWVPNRIESKIINSLKFQELTIGNIELAIKIKLYANITEKTCHDLRKLTCD